MNTVLSSLYLKLCKIEPRHIRLAMLFMTLIASGGVILGLPMPGDVAG